MMNYVLFFLAHALGGMVWAWWLDKKPAPEKTRFAILISSLITSLLTWLMSYGSGSWLIGNCILTGLSSSFFLAYLTYFVYLRIPSRKRGITIGSAAAVGAVINLIVFITLFPQKTGPILAGKTAFTALAILAAGLAAVYLPVCRDFLWPDELPSRLEFEASTWLKPGIVILSIFIILCFFLSYGMQDLAASVAWLGGDDYLAYTRIFMILGFFAGGLICDRYGRHVAMLSCFGLLSLGLLSMALGYKGNLAFTGFCCVQAAGACFSIATRVIFIDIARYYKKTALVCSLGMVLPLVFKQAGIVGATVIGRAYGGLPIFILSLLCIVIAMPLITVLIEKIRDIFLLSLRQVQPVLAYAELAGLAEELPRDEAESVNISIEEAVAATEKTELANSIEAEDTSNELLAAETGEIILTGSAETAARFAEKYGFNRRETQVLELTLHGMTIAEMADNLCISESTVKHYIRQILRKTEMKNRRQLLSLLIQESKI